jgi:uncharacterized membrane protein (UPF0136 family)
MNRLTRSTALKIAAVLSLLIGVSNVILALPIISRGADAVNQGSDTPPYVIILLAVLLGVIAIVAAYGTWKGQRWGIILTILANALNGLSAAPGLIAAPSPGLTVAAGITVLLSIAVIVLCLWRDRNLAAA